MASRQSSAEAMRLTRKVRSHCATNASWPASIGAASKTPAPVRNCLRSLANHAVFGLGLYLAALCLRLLAS